MGLENQDYACIICGLVLSLVRIVQWHRSRGGDIRGEGGFEQRLYLYIISGLREGEDGEIDTEADPGGGGGGGGGLWGL